MIPVLAFNDAITPAMNALNAGERISKAFNKLNTFSPTNGQCDFHSKTSFIQIDGLSLCAMSANGLILETENNPDIVIVVPFSGENHTNIDGVDYRYKADHTAFLAIGQKQRTVKFGSGVGLHFSPSRILASRSAITGSHDHHSILPTKSAVISTETAGISFSALFKSLFSQIDVTGGDTNILSKLALDDSLYRLCATLLYPEILLIDETRNGKRSYVRPEIKTLCEYIAAHLTEAISLTEMESRSGLSARILQKSFQNTFGLSPKQWVRKQRLHAARSVMLNRREPISVTALAYEFCFASPSDFAHHYLLEFGEQPSQTLGRSKLTVSAESSVDFWK
jgi:AraC-like DNA-binding protein